MLCHGHTNMQVLVIFIAFRVSGTPARCTCMYGVLATVFENCSDILKVDWEMN